MSRLVFYRHHRQDGGTRTAVSVDDRTVLHHFQPGEGPSDPALLWYVDLRCEGSRLPTGPDKVLRWLHDQAPVVRDALTRLADKLEVGMDFDSWPLQWPVKNAPRGVGMTVVCSAIRRVTLLEIGPILRDMRDHWGVILDQLEPARRASA